MARWDQKNLLVGEGRGRAGWLACLVVLLTIFPSSNRAGMPAWWLYRDALNGRPADDYAAFNQGQLKAVVTACVEEMNAKLVGGAGTPLNDLVSGWRASESTADNYLLVNLGQLKAVAKPIYDRLNAVHGTSGYYPWTGVGADDYALANLGQLKRVMKLDVTIPPNTSPENGGGLGIQDSDVDKDGLPYWFEILIGTDPDDPDSDNDGIPDGQEDHDSDGISNRAEFLSGTNYPSTGGIPVIGTDTDGDGLSDADEAGLGTDPHVADTDGDGASDGEEQAADSDPTDVNSNPWIRLQIATPVFTR